MKPFYYVLDAASGAELPAKIRPAVNLDFELTELEHWQTSWKSDYIQQRELEKYALALVDTNELLGLGAYRDMPDGVLIYVEYIESAPSSNPTLTQQRKYTGIGAALLAYGVQLSFDYGYGGTIYLKAKTSEIRQHYIRDFGAIPFSHYDPFLLLIDGKAAEDLLGHYLREE